MFKHQGSIEVRTMGDKAQEEHDRLLMERIRKEQENPIQKVADRVLGVAGNLYTNYLYSSGVMLICFAFWAVYPSFVRFRHAHIRRYRRSQLVLRRGFFSTNHMPKWNKKYLQRIVVPPPPNFATMTTVAELVSQGTSLHTTPAASTAPSASAPSSSSNHAEIVENPLETSVCSAIASREEQEASAVTASMNRASREDAGPFAAPRFSVSRSSHSAFASGDAERSETEVSRALARINEMYYSDAPQQFKADISDHVESPDIKAQIMETVKKAKSRVVLKEDHSTMRSIPPGWEVWWASADEEKRRRFCSFWIMGLVMARIMQDLLDMPEMPDLIN